MLEIGIIVGLCIYLVIGGMIVICAEPRGYWGWQECAACAICVVGWLPLVIVNSSGLLAAVITFAITGVAAEIAHLVFKAIG